MNGVYFKRQPIPPFRGVLITDLLQTCFGCPSQWDAKGPGGERIYIRYRNGHFRVSVNEEPAFSTDWGDPSGGVMSTEQMLELTGFICKEK